MPEKWTHGWFPACFRITHLSYNSTSEGWIDVRFVYCMKSELAFELASYHTESIAALDK